MEIDYENVRAIVREEISRDQSARIRELEAELWFVVERGVNQSRILKVLNKEATS